MIPIITPKTIRPKNPTKMNTYTNVGISAMTGGINFIVNILLLAYWCVNKLIFDLKLSIIAVFG